MTINIADKDEMNRPLMPIEFRVTLPYCQTRADIRYRFYEIV